MYTAYALYIDILICMCYICLCASVYVYVERELPKFLFLDKIFIFRTLNKSAKSCAADMT